MKMCFIAGADSIHSYRWIKYFVNKGHEVHWISTTPLNFGLLKNAYYYEIKISPMKAFCFFSGLVKIKKLIEKIEPEILHSHYAGINGMMGAISGFHPHLVTVWGSDVLIAGKATIKKSIVRYILRNADLITCDATHMIDAMVKLGVSKKKISLIHFGIEMDRFHPVGNKAEEKVRLGFSDSPIVLSLRNLEKIYDVETLVQSIPYVLSEFAEVVFIIAGRGSQERHLKQLGLSLGVSEHVRFMGFISNDILPNYLNAADIYVSTSLSDAGISASTAEAMACEVPVVITDSGENKLWVEDGENAFLIPVRKPKALAERIVTLLRSDILRKKFGVGGRKIIQEKNNYYVEMEKMEKIYKELARNRASN
jgi:glycosyltransferase involved in cell wall biosynthesis